MSIEIAIRAILAADAAVAALVADRIHPIVLPQAGLFPALTYQVIDGDSHYSMQGPSGLASRRVQIDCHAETYEEAIDLKGAVIGALSGFQGDVGSPPVRIQGIFRQLERDNYDAELERAGPTLWGKPLDFMVWDEE